MDTIEIRGSRKFKVQVAAALALLKTKSPEAYQVVTNDIGAIEQAKHSGMAAELTPPTLQMNDRSVFYSVTWCASSIAHDSIHSKLYHDYLKQHGERVPEGIWTGETAEKQCIEYQLRLLQKMSAPRIEIRACAWEPTNRYWEVDYDKRDW